MSCGPHLLYTRSLHSQRIERRANLAGNGSVSCSTSDGGLVFPVAVADGI